MERRLRYPRTSANRQRLRLLAAAFLLAAGLTGACAQRTGSRGAVYILTANFEVNPVMQRYIDRGIGDAERNNAKAVVIKLDTPGGLSDSMDKIVQRIQAAKVPVIVYVSPSGGRAASAGTFITMSAHVAAMAPGTEIGAAHPVAAGGGDITGTLGTKVENDAAAKARAIAEARGRNADWAEAAVRQSVSAPVSEAVQKRIVDYQADSIDQLLQKADGRTVRVGQRSLTLTGLEFAPRVEDNLTFLERVLNVLSDPNIAFLLLSLGGLGLLIELVHPGVFFPGVFGVISLILALFVLGTLPVNWAGVGLIGLAFVLFAMEVYVGGFGALGVGGAVSLIAGGLILTSSSNPDFQVSRWLVVTTGAVVAAFFLLFVGALLRARRLPPAVGIETLIGRLAVARSDLAPRGFVFVEGERWQAVAEDAPVRRGEHVVVTAVRGLTLTVRRRPSAPPPSAPAGAP
ncbi:MAG: nodulation protein NfeD [Dehalococcoidia bacterium]|nr:nodulation protein NfeD [Dehalococcoidia bacterium]